MHDGWTPLHNVAKRDDFKIINYIAEHLEYKNPTIYNGCTPLHNAVKQEDKNPTMNNGWTPLHSAAQKGHLKINHI